MKLTKIEDALAGFSGMNNYNQSIQGKAYKELHTAFKNLLMAGTAIHLFTPAQYRELKFDNDLMYVKGRGVEMAQKRGEEVKEIPDYLPLIKKTRGVINKYKKFNLGVDK